MKVCGTDIRIAGRLVRIGSIDGEKYTFPDDPKKLFDELRRCGTRIDIFTFLQRLPATQPAYDYAYELDNLAVVPVSTFDHWWNHQITSFPRNRARQAEKRGAVLREVPFGDELIRGICGIYNECPVRQGKKFPYYGITYEQASAYAGTFLDRSIYIGAFLKDEMIGFAKLVVDPSNTQACMVHILSMVKHKDKAPTNALIAHSVKVCEQRAIPHLVYERFSYGNKSGDSLSHFKSVNGFQKVDVPRYYVPLTRFGQIALKLGLHHRLVDRIPASVAEKLRQVRTFWHVKKLDRPKEA